MIACIRLPYFAASIERRQRPDLDHDRLLLVTPGPAAPRVFAVSPAAAQAGIRVEMGLAAAQTLCPDLQTIPARPGYYRQVLDSLLDALSLFSDRVEIEEGIELRADARRRKSTAYLHPAQIDRRSSVVFMLDPGKLLPAEGLEIAQHIHRAIRDQGRIGAAIGLAAGRFPARVLSSSLRADEVALVRKGREADFIAPFPVDLLPVDGETIRQLHLLGLTTLGQVAALPAGALLNRFGTPGRVMHRLAGGRDTSPVQAYHPRRADSASQRFDSPVENRLIVENVIGELVGVLADRLRAEGLAVHEISLSLLLENSLTLEQATVLRQPGSSTAHLSRTCIDLLAAMQVPCGIIEVAISCGDARPVEARQLSLFEREPVSQERLRSVLTDLVARYGDESFYRVTLIDPDARLPERRVELKQVGGL